MMNPKRALLFLCCFCTSSLSAWQATSPDLMGEGIVIDSKDSLLLTLHPSELIYGNTSHSISSFYIGPEYKYVYSQFDTLLFVLNENNLKQKRVDTKAEHYFFGDAHFFLDQGTVKLAPIRGKQYEFVQGKPRRKNTMIKDKSSSGYTELTFGKYLVKNIEQRKDVWVEARKNGKRIRLYELAKRKNFRTMIHDDFYKKLYLFSHNDFLYVFDAVNIKLITFDKDLNRVNERTLEHPLLLPIINQYKRLATSPKVAYAKIRFFQDDQRPEQLYFFVKDSGLLFSVNQNPSDGDLQLSTEPIMHFQGKLRQIHDDNLYFLVNAHARQNRNLYESLYLSGRIINYIYSTQLRHSQ